MNRLAWSQLRFRPGRALALLAGILVAATAFTVLTAAARTAQIRTIGTVNTHFQPAYDILVRPTGARSSLETATGTVQPDFLSGIYGGITMTQWHRIQQIAGVQVAAPIAMVGYAFMDADFPVWLPAADVAGTGRQLYRINTTWVSANGATKIPEPASYVYVTPDPLHFSFNNGATSETLRGGSTVTPCPAVGTLLGNAVTVQVRGVDYVAVAATVALGTLAVADALVISITERAPELATIRAFGWPERALRRLVITEGALTGIAGSLLGAALGLAGAAVFAGRLPPLLFAAAGTAVAAGILVTCGAALLPAHLLRRLPAAQLLAEE